ncbi:MAG: ABC transporter ATP-binding protein [Hoeflea sp.]|nr:ABC transporter ATP-binding protein [Hoeflea sp.]
MALLEITDLHARYGMAKSLHGISLSVEEGSIVAVIGPNGAGKSTLMDSIMGLVENTGSIRLAGKEITRLDTSEIVRMGVGYAPERAHLFPYMSVRENLLVGAFTARETIDEKLAQVHDLFPVLKTRWAQETATQSGGERQMVSLGRALMSNPKILLVDEPTIGLAPKICDGIAKVLKRLNQEMGLTVVIAEQNVNFALSLAEEIHVLETGSLRVSGTPDQLRTDPELTKAYFGH